MEKLTEKQFLTRIKTHDKIPTKTMYENGELYGLDFSRKTHLYHFSDSDCYAKILCVIDHEEKVAYYTYKHSELSKLLKTSFETN